MKFFELDSSRAAKTGRNGVCLSSKTEQLVVKYYRTQGKKFI